MADNEKLLEAARMIKEHCEAVKSHGECEFSTTGMCLGAINCRMCGHANVPALWRIPKPCRWTENDMIMAKALIAAGFDRAARNESLETVFALKADDSVWTTPSGLFKSINASETVKLSDIIAEYSEVTGHEV